MFFTWTHSTVCHWFYTRRVNANGAAVQIMITDDYGLLVVARQDRLRASLA